MRLEGKMCVVILHASMKYPNPLPYSLRSMVNPLLKVAKMNHCKTDDGLSDFDKNALETCKKMTIDEAYQKEVAARATESDEELHEKRMRDFLNNMAATLNRMSKDENYRQQVAARATITQN